jgi:hypothetical protein
MHMRSFWLMRGVYAGVYALMGPYAAPYAVVYAPHLMQCKRLHEPISLCFSGVCNGQTNPSFAWSIESTQCPKGWVKENQGGSNACIRNCGMPPRPMPSFADVPSPPQEWLRAAEAATAARGHSTQAPLEVHPQHSLGGGGEVR